MNSLENRFSTSHASSMQKYQFANQPTDLLIFNNEEDENDDEDNNDGLLLIPEDNNDIFVEIVEPIAPQYRFEIDQRIKTVRIRILDSIKQPKAIELPGFTQVNKNPFATKKCVELKAKDRFKELKKLLYFFYDTHNFIQILQSCPFFAGFKQLDFDHIEKILFILPKSSKTSNPAYYTSKNEEYEYHGQMKKIPEGEGKFFYSNGDFYIGQVKSQKRNGKGIMLWKDGTKHDGTWKQNFKHGQGTTFERNGDIFVGTYLNNSKEGNGLLKWKNGHTLEAIWKKDLLEGTSIMNSGVQKIQLQWKAGTIVGRNIQTSQNQISLPR